MKKVNWKVLNLALWAEMVLGYFLPFQVTDHLRYQVGFPVAFITVWDKGIGKSPFLSMHLNPIGLLADVLIIYLVILGVEKAYGKVRNRRRNKTAISQERL